MTEQVETHPFTIKGYHVLIAMVMFFAVIIAVNVVFITLAVSSFSGEVTERSYAQGLAFNEVLEARQEQSELGWQARVNQTETGVIISILDAEERPIEGLSFDAHLRHPADMEQDQLLQFTEREAGIYLARWPSEMSGQWILTVRSQGELPFEFEHRLWPS